MKDHLEKLLEALNEMNSVMFSRWLGSESGYWFRLSMVLVWAFCSFWLYGFVAVGHVFAKEEDSE